ncbi:MAG: hypothetical protein R6V12_17465, partial [Candidatus Hydrogenedentota bacterium]
MKFGDDINAAILNGRQRTDIALIKAELRVHLNDRVADSDDLAIGMYYSSNSTWNETDITWNNQPDFAASPTT